MSSGKISNPPAKVDDVDTLPSPLFEQLPMANYSDPVCGLPGVEPMVATVDGKKAVCYERSMVNATPLSAIYVNKVKQVVDAVEEVQAAKAKAEGGGDADLDRAQAAPTRPVD